MLSVLVGPGSDCHAIRGDLELLLRDEYEIDHTTLQVEHSASRGADHDRRIQTRRRVEMGRPGPTLPSES